MQYLNLVRVAAFPHLGGYLSSEIIGCLSEKQLKGTDQKYDLNSKIFYKIYSKVTKDTYNCSKDTCNCYIP